MLGNRIKEKRKAAKLTQLQLGDAVGATKSSVCNWERGIYSPDVDTIERVAEVLRTTAGYLLGYTDDDRPKPKDIDGLHSLSVRSIPLLGSVHAGKPAFAEEDFEGYTAIGADVRCDFALRVKGDSMINARIMDGDIVFIRKQDTVNDGEIAAVLIDDDAALKRVRFLPGGLVMLQPENPRYQPIIVGGESETRDVRILGKAVAFQSDVR